MPCPRTFRDDGQTLYLDVHGCSIGEAMRLVKRFLREGARYGRTSLEVVTGHSTTTTSDAATIKNALSLALEQGELAAWAPSWFWASDGGRCVIGLPLGGTNRPDRIRL